MNNRSYKLDTTLSRTNDTTAITLSSNVRPKRRFSENFLLIWMNTSIDQSQQDYQNILEHLKSVVNDVNVFTQLDACIDFLTEVDDIRVSLILDGTLAQQLVPLIHDIPHLDAIYVFWKDTFGYEQWETSTEWIKVKGVYTKIIPICEQLQLSVRQYIRDNIAVSFVMMNEGIISQNLNQLEPSFMYTQIFKEILLSMEYNEESIKDFIQCWRHYCIDNKSKLDVIAEFERDYVPQSSIWWYTREHFVYSMLNQALRTLEATTIINMGFFIYHLHHQIEQLHQQQTSDHHKQPFIVYRGQGLSTTDFHKLLKTKGGLISFNNFLSTSKNEDISLIFASSVSTKTDMVGVLFKILVDPSVTSSLFAYIGNISYYQTEEEILFSMQAIFRIGNITKIPDSNSLYQVELTLTSDDDPQLRKLTKYIRQEIVGSTGWGRLGQLLIILSQFDKAEQLYKTLLEQTSDESEKALYYNQLGYIKDEQGDYEQSIWYHEKALDIDQKYIHPDHHLLATSYNNIALVHRNMGAYPKAQLFFQKALEIQEKILPSNHPDLATTFNNIGSVHYDLGEYSDALSFFLQALEIFENILPSNHPSLAISYNNIASLHRCMREYSKALSFFNKALVIQQKTLPSNHPDMAISYNNIASLHRNMREYSKSLSYFEKALAIQQKIFPSSHPSLATSYNNIGWVFRSMGDYVQALSYLQQALDIRQRTLPANHPSIQDVRENIEIINRELGKCAG